VLNDEITIGDSVETPDGARLAHRHVIVIDDGSESRAA
jgi:hypothetical protein